ncbi:hypothetical protein DN069_36400 [Streptacidiphilus pinicola]|uniref:Uncharacterized protein n=1 Tax=Streptacidiphilus pinicola TaxID=2219663 RepID=A0A2X0J0E0_9ACTN|nr:hypothetical protein [Streptacidiphilus pinicola]RAG80758.1 hypothetical protein DN069_36400 [Streptacidiphilus pinicola]
MSASQDASPSVSTAPSASAQAQGDTTGTTAPFHLDPAKVPKTTAAALALARSVAAGPDSFGPGFVARTPAESDPASWPVLGRDCVWQQRALPGDVLVSLTRYSRLPAAGGAGEVHTAATVTVHRTVAQADWEIADTLEQALRCPYQQLRDTERIAGLNSVGSGFGTNGNTSADDYLMEMGSYLNPTLGKGKLPYFWAQARLGPVTVAVAVEGGQGIDQQQLMTTLSQGVASMETKVRVALGVSS